MNTTPSSCIYDLPDISAATIADCIRRGLRSPVQVLLLLLLEHKGPHSLESLTGALPASRQALRHTVMVLRRKDLVRPFNHNGAVPSVKITPAGSRLIGE